MQKQLVEKEKMQDPGNKLVDIAIAASIHSIVAWPKLSSFLQISFDIALSKIDANQMRVILRAERTK